MQKFRTIIPALGKIANPQFSQFSQYAAHQHPPPSPSQAQPQGPPGALAPGAPGPTDALQVHQLNDMYMQQQQGVSNRLEADSRGYDTVFSQ